METVILAVVIALVAIAAISGLVVGSRRRKALPRKKEEGNGGATGTGTASGAGTGTQEAPPAEPRLGDEASPPATEEERRTVEDVTLPPVAPPPPAPADISRRCRST
ncbi:signal recognition particle-docking protein FtsY, partial [Streptomyces sp. XM4011]|nr:signal recognition particle-docking protein FtsY [Streptomyces sp. XM4011]